jgi:hypothetical protein
MMDDDDNPVQRPGETVNEFRARQEQSLNDAAREYWLSVAAKGAALPDGFESPGRNRRSRRQPRETEMAKPPSLPASTNPEDINPLAMIVEALRQNTDAAKRAADIAESLQQTLGSMTAASSRHHEQVKREVGSLIIAVQSQTESAKRIVDAEGAKWYWGLMGVMIGILLGLVADDYLVPLLRQWL